MQSRRKEPGTRLFAASVAVVTSFSMGVGAYARDAVIADFKQNCTSCHTIGGGRVTGPDLKHVEERQNRDWLIRFVMDPRGVFDAGDEYALKLKREANGTVMPNLARMTRDRAVALLDLIAAESELEESQFVGVQISDRALTAADIERGRDIVRGSLPLVKRGPACITCHVLTGLGGLGGGRLGPDLTKVFERQQGRKGLVAWLSAPATPVMQATFRDHPLDGEEILALVAYFRETAKLNERTHTTSTLAFILLGVAGTFGVLILFNWIWSYRFRLVRESLLEKHPARGPA